MLHTPRLKVLSCRLWATTFNFANLGRATRLGLVDLGHGLTDFWCARPILANRPPPPSTALLRTALRRTALRWTALRGTGPPGASTRQPEGENKREDPQREEKERKWRREKEKKARNFGPHPSGPHSSGTHPSGPHPFSGFGPPPFWVPPFFFWGDNRKIQSRTRQNTPTTKPGTQALLTPRAHLTPGILGAQPENKPLPSPLSTTSWTLPCNNLEDLDFSQAKHHKKSFVS